MMELDDYLFLFFNSVLLLRRASPSVSITDLKEGGFPARSISLKKNFSTFLIVGFSPLAILFLKIFTLLILSPQGFLHFCINFFRAYCLHALVVVACAVPFIEC